MPCVDGIKLSRFRLFLFWSEVKERTGGGAVVAVRLRGEEEGSCDVDFLRHGERKNMRATTAVSSESDEFQISSRLVWLWPEKRRRRSTLNHKDAGTCLLPLFL